MTIGNRESATICYMLRDRAELAVMGYRATSGLGVEDSRPTARYGQRWPTAHVQYLLMSSGVASLARRAAVLMRRLCRAGCWPAPPLQSGYLHGDVFCIGVGASVMAGTRLGGWRGEFRGGGRSARPGSVLPARLTLGGHR